MINACLDILTRRSFIGQAAVLTAGLSLPSSVLATRKSVSTSREIELEAIELILNCRHLINPDICEVLPPSCMDHLGGNFEGWIPFALSRTGRRKFLHQSLLESRRAIRQPKSSRKPKQYWLDIVYAFEDAGFRTPFSPAVIADFHLSCDCYNVVCQDLDISFPRGHPLTFDDLDECIEGYKAYARRGYWKHWGIKSHIKANESLLMTGTEPVLPKWRHRWFDGALRYASPELRYRYRRELGFKSKDGTFGPAGEGHE